MPPLIHFFLLTLTALLPITNPLGNIGIFLSLTGDETPKKRKKIALTSSIYMFAILVVFFFGGHFIMKFFGLSLEGIRIAGSLLIAKAGFSMLEPKTETTHSDDEHQAAKAKDDISFSPMAMPLMAGPGAIASVLAVTSKVGEAKNHLLSMAGVVAAIFITCVISWIALRQSGAVLKVLGVNGAAALTKLMGFLLLCIGVQLGIDGVMGLVKQH